jgi:exo-beta-1,3-glucanase (GH17 family)
MRTVAAVLALVACVHAGLWASLRTKETAPDFTGQLASVSYAPFVNSKHPDYGERPTVEQIRADLRAIAPYTRAIRTYSSTGGGELVPPIAAEFGLKVTVGAWIDKNQERNEREIRSALDLARHNSNVNAIVVGNETMLRTETSLEDLIKIIQRVKRSSPVPVSTGEIWTAWIDHPELASAVDFIAAHILPYWDGVDASHVVDRTIEAYDKLRRVHPGKRIVIAEFGWPSAGYNFCATPIPARSSRPWCCAISSRAPRPSAWNTTSSRRSISPGSSARAASGPIGASWTRPAAEICLDRPDQRELLEAGGLAVLLGMLLSLPILAIAEATRRKR